MTLIEQSRLFFDALPEPALLELRRMDDLLEELAPDEISLRTTVAFLACMLADVRARLTHAERPSILEAAVADVSGPEPIAQFPMPEKGEPVLVIYAHEDDAAELLETRAGKLEARVILSGKAPTPEQARFITFHKQLAAQMLAWRENPARTKRA